MIGVVERCPPPPIPQTPEPEAEPPPPSPPAPGSCLPDPPPRWEDMYLIHRFNDLVRRRELAGTMRRGIPSENQRPRRSFWRRRSTGSQPVDTFYTGVTGRRRGSVTIARDGARPGCRAGRRPQGHCHGCGSLVKIPSVTPRRRSLRVSGALIVRYSITDPARGTIDRAGILTCQTTLTSIRQVQDWTWTNQRGERMARCQEQ